MAVFLLNTLATILDSCSRHLSRAARKLRPAETLSPASVLSRRSAVVPHAWGSKKMIRLLVKKIRKFPDEEEEHHELWRKTILMGEKCQPLDFSGVIYYDAEGRQLSEIPTPRSPARSPLPSFAPKVPSATANVGKVGHEYIIDI